MLFQTQRLMVAACLVAVMAGATQAADTAEAVEPPWTWQVVKHQGRLWIRSYENGVAAFDYQIGAGGAISQMRDIRAGYRPLLSPSYDGEVTDRLLQFTWWSYSITHQRRKLKGYEQRFNITQGGTLGNQIAPTISVRVNSKSNVIDVYSVPQDQWQPKLQSVLKSKISALTRYEMMDHGVLKVRRVMRVGEVTVFGAPVNFDHLYIEAWSPFLRSASAFDAVAFGVDATGNPNWWYRTGSNLPGFAQLDASRTKGYAVVFKSGVHGSSTAVGLVYGKKSVISPRANDRYRINSMDWDNGVAILPGLTLHSAAAGSLVDQTILLVPRQRLDAAMSRLLTTLVPQVPAPVVYEPGAVLPADLADVARTLRANLNADGRRTDQLVPLIQHE